jgi:phytoene desaturase
VKDETKKEKVVIIGAGPGGLSSAMILAHKGYDVRIYESKDRVGGRNATITSGGYTFEIGPTFVMLPHVFEEIFIRAGKDIKNYVDMKFLPLMYELHYADGRKFDVFFDKAKLKNEIERIFPGESKGYDKYFKENKVKFDRLYRCLSVPYMRVWNYFRLKLLMAFPVMDIPRSVYQVLSKYFKNEDLKIAMSFQAKYLGMSPWECPGAFTILSYVEHAFGLYHPMGGVHKISEAMARVAD